jgi:DNA (cytosine-5)-methyltransferase 1
MVYYNEHDPKAVAWLRELIKEGHIADGVVDDRSIVDVNPYEITHYKQHHFFAGIGGWSLALRLAGWSDDREVVTNSPPCQPFSSAGTRRGTADERHLWPIFRDILAHLKSSIVFGEQVAGPAGCEWLSRVLVDLENLGFEVGAFNLPACCVGSPQKRQRIFWVADAMRKRRASRIRRRGEEAGSESKRLGPESSCSPPRFWPNTPSRGADGKTRRLESGIEPLAHGIPGRVDLLRGFGNAIVPQVAATFIKAYNETMT